MGDDGFLSFKRVKNFDVFLGYILFIRKNMKSNNMSNKAECILIKRFDSSLLKKPIAVQM